MHNRIVPIGIRTMLLLCLLFVPGMRTDADEPSLPSLKLHYRTANQPVLFIIGQNEVEAEALKKACAENHLKLEISKTWDTRKPDFLAYHTIIGGSNNMDFFGPENQDEKRKDRIFGNIIEFVSAGGHLFLYNTCDGRNSSRLKAFGLAPGPVQTSLFQKVPGRTDILFQGFEASVPANERVQSWANLAIDPTVPAITMIARKKEAPLPNQPVLATMPFRSGRISYTTVEPFDDGLWLIPIITRWIARGAPTTLDQLETNVVVDQAELRKLNAREPLPAPPRISSQAEDAFRRKMAQQFWKNLPPTADREQRYIALKTAWELAAEAGDFELVDIILKQARLEFQIDESKIRRELLSLRKNRTTFISDDLPGAAWAWAENAFKHGDFSAAQQLALIAQELAASTENKQLQNTIQNRLKHYQPYRQAAIAISPLENDLASGTLTPQQRTRLGRFHAFVMGDWIGGLDLLRKGNDPELKELAEFDLSDSADPLKQLALAQRWQAFAKTVSDLERTAIERRARGLYRMAIRNLDGADLANAEQGLQSLPIPPAEITFHVKIDGCSQLIIDPSRMSWIQLYGKIPAEMRVNHTQRWELESESEYVNQGVNHFLPEDVELKSPQLKKTRGRGLVLIRRTLQPETVVIDINDIPPGEDDYEFILSVGNRTEF